MSAPLDARVVKLCNSCMDRPAEVETGHGSFCVWCATDDEIAEHRARQQLEREADATARRADQLDRAGWLDDVEGRTDHGREDAREAKYEREHDWEFRR